MPPLARGRFPRFAGLKDQPTTGIAAGHFAVKIDVFGNQNIFKDYVRTARWIFQSSHGIASAFAISLQSIKSYFSPYGCQRADSFLSVCGKNREPSGKNGGPDRTRTYDPRLIKAVL